MSMLGLAHKGEGKKVVVSRMRREVGISRNGMVMLY